jgi:hypothetical protein
MIVTVTVVMILTMLLVVVLGQAVHNNVATVYGARRATALAVAEGGTNWAIAALQADPTTAAAASNRAVPVADGSGATGTATVTVRQGTPSSPGKLGWYTVYSTGSLGIAGAPTRTVRVVLGPSPSFPFALYADTSLTLEQNACIVGTVFSQGDVSFKNNAAVAGTGTIRGSLISETGVITQFNGANKAACPSTVNGEAVDTTYDVHGDVLAGGGSLAPCRTAPAGAIDASTSGFNLNGATVGGRACNNPPPYTMPEYTFLPRNYGTIQYYGKPPGYGSASVTAVADFNGALSAGTLPSSAGALDRAYVVWQDLSAYQASGTTPPALELDAATLRIAADTLVYTNVPVDFGNTSKVSAAAACSTTGTPACPTFVVVSSYPGSPCSGGVGNCPSIYGGNQIEFRPEVAVLLFSHDGTIELKNDCNSADCNQSNQGAFYGSTVDAKNNLNINYSPRIADALGFGAASLLQRSYQELPPCPAGQASCRPGASRRPAAALSTWWRAAGRFGTAPVRGHREESGVRDAAFETVETVQTAPSS